MQTVLLEQGATVEDALAAAGLPTDSEARCNGDTYTASDEVEDAAPWSRST